LVEEFKTLVDDVWKEAKARCPEACYSLDSWHGCLVMLRSKLKGWNIRRMGDQKKEKKLPLDQFALTDKQAEDRDLSHEE
jgi:hypothetical protein